MFLDLANLDELTRRFMVLEFDADVASGRLYRSPQLTDEGQRDYRRLLRDALADGTVASFAQALVDGVAVRPRGRWLQSKVPPPADWVAEAASDLAEREFHRFYLRGLCLRALDEGVTALVIYRAKPARRGRASADSMIGTHITSASLLEDLRSAFTDWPPNGLPQCRDPGLSVRLP